MITIQGLSPRQCLFADILWKCQGRDHVEQFVQSLPLEFQQEARTVLNMMVAAVFDELSDTSDAAEILNRYR